MGIALFLDRTVYRRIDDLILVTENGTTQIDHVIVSRFGIFVIETKNMKGWIYGNANDAQWTQALFGKKYRFQNPLRQNYRHTRAIAEKLNIDHEAVIPVIFFIGDCTFKTNMPPQVMRSGVSSYIRSFTAVWFSNDEVLDYERHLRDTKKHTLYTRTSHVQSLKER